MHVIPTFFIIVAALVVMTLVCAFWLIVTILRGLTRLLLGPGLKRPPVLPPASIAAPSYPRDYSNARRCAHEACRAQNPVEARFCRRCGQPIGPTHAAAAGRAAML